MIETVPSRAFLWASHSGLPTLFVCQFGRRLFFSNLTRTFCENKHNWHFIISCFPPSTYSSLSCASCVLCQKSWDIIKGTIPSQTTCNNALQVFVSLLFLYFRNTIFTSEKAKTKTIKPRLDGSQMSHQEGCRMYRRARLRWVVLQAIINS